MKTSIFIAFALFFSSTALALAQTSDDEIGAEWNNSTSVEFPATSTDEEGNVIYNYYGDDSQYFGGNNGAPPVDNTVAGVSDPSEVTITLNDPGAQAAAEAAAQALLDTLAAAHAFTGTDGTLSQDDYDFFFGSGDSGGEDFRLIFGGGLIREALKEKGIEKVTLEGWDPKKKDQNIINWIPKTKGDLSIIAAAAIVRDANIEAVQLLLNRIDVTYRLKSYFFYLIPFNFSARIGVAPLAPENLRVSVKYPWYQLFLWKPISEADLDALLEHTVSGTLKIQMANDLERQGRLFGSIADALRAIAQP